MSLGKYFLLIFAVTIFSITAHAGVIDPNLPIISYINFQSLDPVAPLTISGQLRIPTSKTGEQIPAVVIVHGSAGVDSRGKLYAEALNNAGIATLEIDMWAARGLQGDLNRPSGVPETLPDAYGALKFLSEQPRIDPDRIGIMGFSWGGIVTMLTATSPYTDQYTNGKLKFAAHVANYPVCWIYNFVPEYEFQSFTGSPVLIQIGELDDYDESAEVCRDLVLSLPQSVQDFMAVEIYKNATHAWDRLQPEITITDPVSHLGTGGQVHIVPNPGEAFKSRDTVVDFFQKIFGKDSKPRTNNTHPLRKVFGILL
ncbi:MAG: dienelactone hydrolase family protein [Candidatus Nitrosoglobus sp.]|jgi:dienelactone hydrolase